MTDVLLKLNAVAAYAPCPHVFTGNRKLARFIGFLQTASHDLYVAHGLLVLLFLGGSSFTESVLMAGSTL